MDNMGRERLTLGNNKWRWILHLPGGNEGADDFGWHKERASSPFFFAGDVATAIQWWKKKWMKGANGKKRKWWGEGRRMNARRTTGSERRDLKLKLSLAPHSQQVLWFCSHLRTGNFSFPQNENQGKSSSESSSSSESQENRSDNSHHIPSLDRWRKWTREWSDRQTWRLNTWIVILRMFMYWICRGHFLRPFTYLTRFLLFRNLCTYPPSNFEFSQTKYRFTALNWMNDHSPWISILSWSNGYSYP